MGWKGSVLQSPPPLGGDYTPCLFTAGLGWVGGDCSSVPGMYYHPPFCIVGGDCSLSKMYNVPPPIYQLPPPPSRDFSGISIRWGVIVPRGGWLLGGGQSYIFSSIFHLQYKSLRVGGKVCNQRDQTCVFHQKHVYELEQTLYWFSLQLFFSSYNRQWHRHFI